jgi:predicted secreted protein
MAETGSTLSLPTGTEIVLRLPEISGTAYLWHLVEGEGFELLSDSYELQAEAPGGENQRVLRLCLKQPGTYELRLDRYRPWETPYDADASFHVITIVN